MTCRFLNRWILPAILIVMLANAQSVRADAPVDFRRDVIPALTKAGCNAGACHGSFRGRGGFTLSLLGFNPAADYDEIVKASRGRRVNPASPEHSLLLRKATATIAHGGGRRLHPATPAYQLLRDYIRQGMTPPRDDGPTIVRLDVKPQNVSLKPGESVTLSVSARWSDGVTRDVTAWSLFDSRDKSLHEVSSEAVVTAHKAGKSPVSVRYLGQVAAVVVTTPFGDGKPFAFTPVNFIDTLAAAEWRRMSVAPAPEATDSEFVRRVSLDLTGTLPAPDEVRRFLASSDSERRRKLIDALLERPEYVDYWALKWGDLLRVHRRYVGEKGVGSFGGWLKRALRDNKPLDKMASELLTAEGNLFTHGPVAYFFVDPNPEELAEATSQLFLGVRLQCARCHHHPFEAWGQDDYYGLAAFFTRLEVRENGDKGRFGGLQTLRAVPRETKKLQVASPPRLFGAKVTVPEGGDARHALAEWVTRHDNPYFARNFVNRYWAYLTGRGLVEPIDDLRATNPASNSELLDALANDFIKHRYDVKHLLRTICNSRVYQLASEVATERDRDGSLSTHRVPKRLPAEVLLDAVNEATGAVEVYPGTLPGTRAIALPDPGIVSSFLATFGRPLRNNPCECAREGSPDLLQALHLLNNSALQGKIASPQGRLARLLARKLSDDDTARELYLATLARLPSDRDLQSIRGILKDAPSRPEGWEDVLWAILNSPEFTFNH